jgi:hypothetical protein
VGRVMGWLLVVSALPSDAPRAGCEAPDLFFDAPPFFGRAAEKGREPKPDPSTPTDPFADRSQTLRPATNSLPDRSRTLRRATNSLPDQSQTLLARAFWGRSRRVWLWIGYSGVSKARVWLRTGYGSVVEGRVALWSGNGSVGGEGSGLGQPELDGGHSALPRAGVPRNASGSGGPCTLSPAGLRSLVRPAPGARIGAAARRLHSRR